MRKRRRRQELTRRDKHHAIAKTRDESTVHELGQRHPTGPFFLGMGVAAEAETEASLEDRVDAHINPKQLAVRDVPRAEPALQEAVPSLG